MFRHFNFFFLFRFVCACVSVFDVYGGLMIFNIEIRVIAFTGDGIKKKKSNILTISHF